MTQDIDFGSTVEVMQLPFMKEAFISARAEEFIEDLELCPNAYKRHGRMHAETPNQFVDKHKDKSFYEIAQIFGAEVFEIFLQEEKEHEKK